eukprot:scaffold30254_cov107-Isochrysis_galbana.AAC.5
MFSAARPLRLPLAFRPHPARADAGCGGVEVCQPQPGSQGEPARDALSLSSVVYGEGGRGVAPRGRARACARVMCIYVYAWPRYNYRRAARRLVVRFALSPLSCSRCGSYLYYSYRLATGGLCLYGLLCVCCVWL